MGIIEKAELLKTLHSSILALPNAWDVASARLVEAAGARAVATTSAGVAWSLGAPDGDQLDRDRALELVARVAAAVDVPVTADMESGFATTPEGVAETIRGVVAAGAVGVNLEDAMRPATEHAERIAAARQATDVQIYLNARIDTFLRSDGDIDETLDRAARYLAAGADGIFVPGVTDLATISLLVKGIDAPLNILAGPGSPTLAEFAAAGVARVSLGSAIASAAYAVVQRSAEEFLTAGTYGPLSDALDYGDLNKLFR